MATCPSGHDSSNDDYCSECGLLIDAAAPAEPPPTPPASASDPAAPAIPAAPAEVAPGALTSVGAAPTASGGSLACPNCADPHGRDDVFCENCGYDFITGSLPQPEVPLTSGAAPVPGASVTPAQVLATVTATFDAEFYKRMDGDGVLTAPDPEPDVQTIEITNSPVLIGRASPSRNIYPDIDIASDPAASGRHARLDRRPDGAWTITDLGSTNGTYLGRKYEALDPNVSRVIAAGTPVYVGAWTRLDLKPA